MSLPNFLNSLPSHLKTIYRARPNFEKSPERTVEVERLAISQACSRSVSPSSPTRLTGSESPVSFLHDWRQPVRIGDIRAFVHTDVISQTSLDTIVFVQRRLRLLIRGPVLLHLIECSEERAFQELAEAFFWWYKLACSILLAHKHIERRTLCAWLTEAQIRATSRQEKYMVEQFVLRRYYAALRTRYNARAIYKMQVYLYNQRSTLRAKSNVYHYWYFASQYRRMIRFRIQNSDMDEFYDITAILPDMLYKASFYIDVFLANLNERWSVVQDLRFAILRNTLLAPIFVKWLLVVRMRRSRKNFLMSLYRGLFRDCFSRWCAISRNRNKTLRQYLDMWKHAVRAGRQEREKLLLAANFRRSKLSTKYLNIWIQYHFTKDMLSILTCSALLSKEAIAQFFLRTLIMIIDGSSTYDKPNNRLMKTAHILLLRDSNPARPTKNRYITIFDAEQDDDTITAADIWDPMLASYNEEYCMKYKFFCLLKKNLYARRSFLSFLCLLDAFLNSLRRRWCFSEWVGYTRTRRKEVAAPSASTKAPHSVFLTETSQQHNIAQLPNATPSAPQPSLETYLTQNISSVEAAKYLFVLSHTGRCWPLVRDITTSYKADEAFLLCAESIMHTPLSALESQVEKNINTMTQTVDGSISIYTYLFALFILLASLKALQKETSYARPTYSKAMVSYLEDSSWAARLRNARRLMEVCDPDKTVEIINYYSRLSNIIDHEATIFGHSAAPETHASLNTGDAAKPDGWSDLHGKNQAGESFRDGFVLPFLVHQKASLIHKMQDSWTVSAKPITSLHGVREARLQREKMYRQKNSSLMNAIAMYRQSNAYALDHLLLNLRQEIINAALRAQNREQKETADATGQNASGTTQEATATDPADHAAGEVIYDDTDATLSTVKMMLCKCFYDSIDSVPTKLQLLKKILDDNYDNTDAICLEDCKNLFCEQCGGCLCLSCDCPSRCRCPNEAPYYLALVAQKKHMTPEEVLASPDFLWAPPQEDILGAAISSVADRTGRRLLLPTEVDSIVIKGFTVRAQVDLRLLNATMHTSEKPEEVPVIAVTHTKNKHASRTKKPKQRAPSSDPQRAASNAQRTKKHPSVTSTKKAHTPSKDTVRIVAAETEMVRTTVASSAAMLPIMRAKTPVIDQLVDYRNKAVMMASQHESVPAKPDTNTFNAFPSKSPTVEGSLAEHQVGDMLKIIENELTPSINSELAVEDVDTKRVSSTDQNADALFIQHLLGTTRSSYQSIAPDQEEDQAGSEKATTLVDVAKPHTDSRGNIESMFSLSNALLHSQKNKPSGSTIHENVHLRGGLSDDDIEKPSSEQPTLPVSEPHLSDKMQSDQAGMFSPNIRPLIDPSNLQAGSVLPPSNLSGYQSSESQSDQGWSGANQSLTSGSGVSPPFVADKLSNLRRSASLLPSINNFTSQPAEHPERKSPNDQHHDSADRSAVNKHLVAGEDEVVNQNIYSSNEAPVKPQIEGVPIGDSHEKPLSFGSDVASKANIAPMLQLQTNTLFSKDTFAGLPSSTDRTTKTVDPGGRASNLISSSVPRSAQGCAVSLPKATSLPDIFGGGNIQRIQPSEFKDIAATSTQISRSFDTLEVRIHKSIPGGDNHGAHVAYDANLQSFTPSRKKANWKESTDSTETTDSFYDESDDSMHTNDLYSQNTTQPPDGAIHDMASSNYQDDIARGIQQMAQRRHKRFTKRKNITLEMVHSGRASAHSLIHSPKTSTAQSLLYQHGILTATCRSTTLTKHRIMYEDADNTGPSAVELDPGNLDDQQPRPPGFSFENIEDVVYVNLHYKKLDAGDETAVNEATDSESSLRVARKIIELQSHALGRTAIEPLSELSICETDLPSVHSATSQLSEPISDGSSDAQQLTTVTKETVKRPHRIESYDPKLDRAYKYLAEVVDEEDMSYIANFIESLAKNGDPYLQGSEQLLRITKDYVDSTVTERRLVSKYYRPKFTHNGNLVVVVPQYSLEDDEYNDLTVRQTFEAMSVRVQAIHGTEDYYRDKAREQAMKLFYNILEILNNDKRVVNFQTRYRYRKSLHRSFAKELEASLQPHQSPSPQAFQLMSSKRLYPTNDSGAGVFQVLTTINRTFRNVDTKPLYNTIDATTPQQSRKYSVVNVALPMEPYMTTRRRVIQNVSTVAKANLANSDSGGKGIVFPTRALLTGGTWKYPKLRQSNSQIVKNPLIMTEYVLFNDRPCFTVESLLQVRRSRKSYRITHGPAPGPTASAVLPARTSVTVITMQTPDDNQEASNQRPKASGFGDTPDTPRRPSSIHQLHRLPHLTLLGTRPPLQDKRPFDKPARNAKHSSALGRPTKATPAHSQRNRLAPARIPAKSSPTEGNLLLRVASIAQKIPQSLPAIADYVANDDNHDTLAGIRQSSILQTDEEHSLKAPDVSV